MVLELVPLYGLFHHLQNRLPLGPPGRYKFLGKKMCAAVPVLRAHLEMCRIVRQWFNAFKDGDRI